MESIPIIVSEQKELINIYLAKEKKEFLLKLSKKKDTVDAISEEDILFPLISVLPDYYWEMFKNRLENRLEISLSEKMKHIKPN